MDDEQLFLDDESCIAYEKTHTHQGELTPQAKEALAQELISQSASLANLDLSIPGLEEVPLSLWNLRQLTELQITDACFSQMPYEIGQLPKLRLLDINRCNLTSIHDQITSCCLLESVSFSHNGLTSIVPLRFLSLLRVIDLSHNDIRDIAPLVNLRNLRSINIAYNGIGKIPDTVSRLNALESLDISHNALYDLPSKLSMLTALKTLVLFGNFDLLHRDSYEKILAERNLKEFFTTLGKGLYTKEALR